MSGQDTHVVIGAGQAGCRGAEELRRRAPDARIVLIGAELHPPYERPSLSKAVLAGKQEPEALCIKDRKFFEDVGIELRLGTLVDGLDPGRRTVHLDSGESITYDGLLLSTGSLVKELTVPGHDLKGIHYLRTIDDAVRLQRHLRSARRLVIVGGGFIGLEVAATARQAFDCRVTVLEAGSTVLQRGIPEEMRRTIAELHHANGVNLHLNCPVIRFEGEQNVERVVCENGERIAADCVVVGIGIEPQVTLAREAGLAVQDGIIVNEFCETSTEGIFAAGEVTSHWNRQLEQLIRLESWQTAQLQPPVAAENMLGGQTPYVQIPWFWTEQYGRNIQLVGIIQSDETQATTRHYANSERFVTFYTRGNKLIGAYGADSSRDIRVVQKCLEAGRSLPIDAMSDPAVDLRKLVKRTG